MIHVVSALFGALFTVAVAFACGRLLLRSLRLRFYREEERIFAFVTGAACLSLLVFALAAVRQARPWVFLVFGAAVIAAARLRGPGTLDPLPPLAKRIRIAFGALFAAFGIFYFCTALAPETSPDGSWYHLGLVSRYLRAGGFYRIINMYAALSAGAEMLFLHAFAFGRHSAAALTHFAFYLTLPLAMLTWGRRFRLPLAAVTGALLVFLSPIVAYDGSAAYIDVALACVLFCMFYLLQIWDRERTPALLVLVGLLAGFAFAIKYTAFLAVPYAAGFVAWRLVRKRRSPVRALAVLCGCALLLIAPWLVRNWIWYGNPLAPFYNAWFPNPHFHIGFEDDYRAQMANWGYLPSKWEIPLEVTVRGGKLNGLLGPAFLLLPVAVLALRRSIGRQLLLAAAVFGATYPANLGTRFLIPMLPFASLALGLVLAEWKWAAPLFLAFHALTTWPPNLKYTCDPHAMRIEKFPHKAALRIEKEDDYLRWKMPTYEPARMLDEHVPPGGRVLGFNSPPDAYTSRDTLVAYQAALNQNLTQFLSSPTYEVWHPKKRWTLRFGEQAVRRIRVVLAGRAENPYDYWTINELRVYRQGRELPREPQWRLRSDPNPWEIQFAFDNNPISRWRSWQTSEPGMFVEIDFGRIENIDEVRIDHIPNQEWSKVWVEGWLADGRQKPLGGSPEESDIPVPENMRRWAAAEIKWNGVEYLLIEKADREADDIHTRTHEYGITFIAEKNGWRLYRID